MGNIRRFLKRKLWGIPVIVLVVVSLMAIAGGAYAYTVLHVTVDVEVQEPITLVGPDTVQVSLYPQESRTVTFTLANASGIGMQVDILITVIPDPGSDLTITVPNKVTVPALGQIPFDVVVEAKKSAAPVNYVITVVIDR